MNENNHHTWEYIHGADYLNCASDGAITKEEALKSIRTGRMYHEGLLEFEENKISAESGMFENAAIGELYDTGHRVWSVRPDGVHKYWFMVNAEAFKELVSMAIECQERRNTEGKENE